MHLTDHAMINDVLQSADESMGFLGCVDSGGILPLYSPLFQIPSFITCHRPDIAAQPPIPSGRGCQGGKGRVTKGRRDSNPHPAQNIVRDCRCQRLTTPPPRWIWWATFRQVRTRQDFVAWDMKLGGHKNLDWLFYAYS